MCWTQTSLVTINVLMIRCIFVWILSGIDVAQTLSFFGNTGDSVKKIMNRLTFSREAGDQPVFFWRRQVSPNMGVSCKWFPFISHLHMKFRWKNQYFMPFSQTTAHMDYKGLYLDLVRKPLGQFLVIFPEPEAWPFPSNPRIHTTCTVRLPFGKLT